ncbi:lymphocyte cytosolic protein 2-like isoform X2 [Coccinella septempunctata]|uniref:lymphocyte cytosolic protein 2-like isoform X2 n=1 Tax=Coccinella septempunctata TaxID=41139 RepID=UPI001D07D927|nr:lymphocyte cytosolic protein 2-like isoform X2 [Coccinella septempunctata]
MGFCCCVCRRKKDHRSIVTNVSVSGDADHNEREALNNRESTYTTSYSLQCSENNQLSTQSSPNGPDPLTPYNWYFGYISRMQAHELLRLEGNGTFLVRRATDVDTDYPYIISVKHKPPDGIAEKENYHYRIRRDENGYFTLGWNLYFKTVKDLLDYYKGKTDILKVPLKTFIDQNHPVR